MGEKLGGEGITQNPDKSLNLDNYTKIQDALNGAKDKGAKLTPQAVQKLSTAQGLLSQIEHAKGLVDQFTPNPKSEDYLGGTLGPLVDRVVGPAERGYQGLYNDTPEGQYGTLSQSIYEGVGKFISNSARQKVIDENMALTSASRLGDPAGAKQAWQNIQDIVRQDLLDQSQGYSEQNYKKIQDAVTAANTIGVTPSVSSPVTATTQQPQYEIRTAPNGQQYRVLLGH